ncbi:MAG: DMT family transporter [Candidatus Omnitrophota bacterium]
MNKRSKLELSAIVTMIQAAVAFSLMALCVKIASRTLPSYEIVFARSVIGLALLVYWIRKKHVSFWGKEKRLLIQRGVAGFIALSLYFYTLSKLPLGTAVILNHTAPLFVALLSTCFLKEKLSPGLWAAIGIAFAGLYLVVGADVRTWNFPMLAGLVSAVFLALAYFSLHSIQRSESPLTVVFYFMLICVGGSLACLPFGFRVPDTKTLGIVIAMAVFAFYGQIWMTIAFRRARASLVSPFIYVTPFLGFLYGVFFFGETLTPARTLGALLVIASGGWISFFETKKKPAKVTLT